MPQGAPVSRFAMLAFGVDRARRLEGDRLVVRVDDL
jgi:hypothetical protein